MSSPHTIDLLAWLSELGDISQPLSNQWQIHKAQITDSTLCQDLPIKLIYHYERLDEAIKAQFPLNGSLLKQFNIPMTREQFISLPELAGLSVQDVAEPWQLKFIGKLVIFTQTPEVAIRLWFTNTLKDFELVYAKTLDEAVEASFHHWQFIDKVEVVCKTPDVILTAQVDEENPPWQIATSPTFEPLPSVISLAIQKVLNDSQFVKEHWLPVLIDLAKNKIDDT